VINYIIDNMYIKGSGYGSLGMTSKYYMNGYWYKQNCNGYEGKSEYLCSLILKNSNINDFVEYEECFINGKAGCRSKQFTHAGEQVITFHKLYSMTRGGELANRIALYSQVSDRIQFVLDFVYQVTGTDCTQYLNDILYFDMLTLDVDRHFSNLALIKSNSAWKTAPLFDFGASFFSLQHVFKKDMTFKEKLAIMTPQPFSRNFEEQASALGNCRIRLNYKKIEQAIQAESPYFQYIIMYQLNKYKNIFS